MGWFMPSYGRPERLRDLLDAEGGWEDDVTVLINEDDPDRERYYQVCDGLTHAGRYSPWHLVEIPAGSRCSDAHRIITERWPDEAFYGLICDDNWPVTPGWQEALEEAAGDRYFAIANGAHLFPKIRNSFAIGGGTVRAMGTLVPAPVKHNFEDDIWDRVAADFHLLRPMPDVIVEHRHWSKGSAENDKTYERGSADFDNDRQIFQEWLHSDDHAQMNLRIANFLDLNVGQVNPKDIRLVIVSPIQNEQVDVAYHKSLNATLLDLAKSGFTLSVIEGAGGSNVGKAREKILWMAMRRNPTHLLWIDADMGWEPMAVRRLLCSGHEFCAVPGAKKQEDQRLACNFLPDPQVFHDHTSFLKIRDVGFAFVLLKASVIEKMCAAYPELEYNAGENREWALFMEMIDKTDIERGPLGERLSEDLSFCRRWRAIGGEIWVDPQSAILHAGRKEYTGKVADYLVSQEPQLAAVA